MLDQNRVRLGDRTTPFERRMSDSRLAQFAQFLFLFFLLFLFRGGGGFAWLGLFLFLGGGLGRLRRSCFRLGFAFFLGRNGGVFFFRLGHLWLFDGGPVNPSINPHLAHFGVR